MCHPDYKSDISEERVKIIATRKKEDIVPLGFREGMLNVYDSSSTGMISDLVKRLNKLDLSDWVEATVSYRLKQQNH